MPRHFVDNPPWVTKIIADNFDLLQSKVLPAYMPVLTDARSRGSDLVVEIPELGCGAYGCVLPVDDPEVVFKLTTDVTEYELVTKLLEGVVPPGMTRYHAWVELNGHRRGRPVFGLWREAAEDIGELAERLAPTTGVDRRTAHAAITLLSEQKVAATEAYTLLAQSAAPDALYMEAILHRDVPVAVPLEDRDAIARCTRQRPARAVAMLLDYFRACTLALYGGPLDAVARALVDLFERGVMVADVHAKNVGRVRRGAESLWVITDPGNVAVLPQPWPA